jgi:hypothetical protein
MRLRNKAGGSADYGTLAVNPRTTVSSSAAKSGDNNQPLRANRTREGNLSSPDGRRKSRPQPFPEPSGLKSWASLSILTNVQPLSRSQFHNLLLEGQEGQGAGLVSYHLQCKRAVQTSGMSIELFKLTTRQSASRSFNLNNRPAFISLSIPQLFARGRDALMQDA